MSEKIRGRRPTTDDRRPTTDDATRPVALSALPDGWQVVRLGDVIQPRRDLIQPSSDGKARYVGLEHIDSGNARLSRWGTESEVKSSKNKFFAGDILYGKLRPYLDKVVLAEWEGICATDILVFVADRQRALPEFIAYLLHTRAFLNHAISTTSGTNHPRTSWQALQAFAFALPPLPEQRAIARVLATLQRAVEAQDQLIAATRAFKRALMHHLFTYGAVPPADAARVPLKETEIGAVPVGWEVKNLGQIAEIKGGKRLPKGHKFSDAPTQYPYIRVVDLENGTVNKSNLKFLKPEDYEIIKRYTISQDDVYISIAGTIGLVGIIPKELNGANLTENAAKIVINNPLQVDQQYLAYFLASEVGQAQIASRTAKTSQPKLALARIQQIPFLCPSLAEQRAIARILTAVDAKIAAEEKRKAALQTLFKTMLHQLMTGQVRIITG